MRIFRNSPLNNFNPAGICFNSREYSSAKSIKVSVILPIYNQEKYLATALDSLRNQTLEETEFICVNDGSDSTKDCSLEILEDYASRDSRVKIINQENQGTGRTRNNGIRAAQGKYIAFLDPDDWFDNDALESAYLRAEKQNCDMLVFNHKRVDETTGNVTPAEDIGQRIRNFYPKFNKDKVFSWLEIKPVVFRALYWMAWNKLYNKEFVESANLSFSDCNLAEDNAFVFGATLKAKKIGFTDKYLYNYLQHDGSAVRQVSDKNLCIFKAIEDVKRILASLNLGEFLKQEFDNYIVKLISLHAKQIKSQDKLVEMCLKHLSFAQNTMLKEQNIVKGLKI